MTRGWLEVALDYRCNLRCLGCHACADTEESARLSGNQALQLLRASRAEKSALWIGGGEPTLRDELPALVKAARALGYDPVLVQTNGMRLAYPAYREALLAAGVTDLSFNVKSWRAALHDELGRGESHALLLQALEGVRGRTRIAADVLLTKRTMVDLPETVRFFAGRGVERISLWLLSAADATAMDEAVRAEIPGFRELVPHLAAAHAAARAAGVALTSWHTPPCVLPPALREMHTPAAALALTVVGPDRRAFALEDSPFEGGAYVEACEGCSARGVCGGPRADYRAIHGDSDFVRLGGPATEGL